MQQLFPPPPGVPAVPAAPDAAISLLGRLYAYPPESGPDRPWVRANMVASADGAVALDGRSGGLSGPGDRQLFRVLRSLADAILVGAGTARAEKYKPVRAAAMVPELRGDRPVTPPIAVVSGSGRVDPESPLIAQAPPEARTIVITGAGADPAAVAGLARHADVVTGAAGHVTSREMVAALTSRGHGRILAEGGPGLLAGLAADDLLDELCLTLSPVLAGGSAGRILAGQPSLPDAPQGLRLAHVLTADGFLFCRYVRER